MKPFAYLTIAGLALAPAFAFAVENEQAAPAATSAAAEAAPASSAAQPAAAPESEPAKPQVQQKARAAGDEKKQQAEKKPEVSRQAYSRLVAAEIRKHTPKTTDAKAGTISVAFTIGASGRVVSQKIQGASDPALEPIARKILAAVHAPPPPGGSFSAVQAFNFR